MLEFSVLASGSKANCTYVSDGTAKVLLDCGLSGKQAAIRLDALGVEADNIDALVVSHEHDDHVRGVRIFSKRHQTDVYANRGTVESSRELCAVPEERLRYFDTGTAFSVGGMSFEPFSLVHDAADPVGFRITSGGAALAVLTDLGQLTTLVREKVRDVNALVLESNHDPEMLREAPYPWELKQRIRSRSGHLENAEAGKLLAELSSENGSRLRVAVAAHISEKSNTAELVLDTFRNSWGEGESPEFVVADAAAPTALYRL